MEMQGIQRAIDCADLACRLEAAAVGKDEVTARSLFRAAAKYREGVHMALADVIGVAGMVGRPAVGDAAACPTGIAQRRATGLERRPAR